MRAVVLHGRRDVRLEEVAEPKPNTGELLLKITTAGICGTDAAFYEHGPEVLDKAFAPRCPVTLGHEFAGLVAAVGPEVTKFGIGDLVVSGASIACGECRPCRKGSTNMCLRNETAGIHRNGGLAEYCALPAWSCERADNRIGGDAAALAQPMAIAHHGIQRARLRAGERALVIGVGGVGAFATWAAAQLGADVTAVDLDPVRLEHARDLGASTTVLAGDAPLPELLTAVDPFDAIYEITGAASALVDALVVAERGTRVVVIGAQKQQATFDPARMAAQEIEVLGSAAHVRAVDLPAAIALLAARSEGWADLAPEALPLELVVEQGLVPLAERRAPQVKILVDPTAASVRPYRN
jgi:(R,R)-butanediol dehydrogenase / meso-butanediol dehydrogenase / diacetyl reductase